MPARDRGAQELQRLPVQARRSRGAAGGVRARALRLRAVVHAQWRGGRRERLQRARARLRQPGERDGGDPHARRAHRRRRSRAHGRRHPGARRRRARDECRLACGAEPSPPSWRRSKGSRGSRSTASPASRTRA